MAAALPFPKSDVTLAEAGWEAAVGNGRTHQGKTILSEVKVIPQVKAEPETKAKVTLDISGVFRGRELTRKERRVTCGIAPIDELIGGGIVRGRVSEIIGNPGAGRTSLAAAFAASITGRDEVAAWIDAAGSFDPESMAAAGVDLARLLWVAMPAGYRERETEFSYAAPYGSGDFSHRHSRDLFPRPAASDFSQGLSREIAPYSARGLDPELTPNKEQYVAEDVSACGGRAKRAASAIVLKAAEWILAAGGFGLVVIDCGGLRDGKGRVGSLHAERGVAPGARCGTQRDGGGGNRNASDVRDVRRVEPDAEPAARLFQPGGSRSAGAVRRPHGRGARDAKQAWRVGRRGYLEGAGGPVMCGDTRIRGDT